MSDGPATDPAALIARWEALDESRRSAGIAHGHARALLRLLREMDAEVAGNFALGLLGRVVWLKDAADARFAAADHATAIALHAAGPAEVGAWRYRGACVGGLWVTVKEAVEFAATEDEGERPPVAGHACTAIENDSEAA